MMASQRYKGKAQLYEVIRTLAVCLQSYYNQTL